MISLRTERLLPWNDYGRQLFAFILLRRPLHETEFAGEGRSRSAVIEFHFNFLIFKAVVFGGFVGLQIEFKNGADFAGAMLHRIASFRIFTTSVRHRLGPFPKYSSVGSWGAPNPPLARCPARSTPQPKNDQEKSETVS